MGVDSVVVHVVRELEKFVRLVVIVVRRFSLGAALRCSAFAVRGKVTFVPVVWQSNGGEFHVWIGGFLLLDESNVFLVQLIVVWQI